MFVGFVAIDEDNKMSRLPVVHELRKTLKSPVETPKMVKDRLVAAIKILSHECDCLHYRYLIQLNLIPRTPDVALTIPVIRRLLRFNVSGFGRVPSRI
jgi:hypothetical protein